MTPDKEFNWIVAFTFVDSLNRIFYGMYSTFLGPSQPYLARKVGVDIDTIAWIQPFGKELIDLHKYLNYQGVKNRVLSHCL